MTKVHVSNHPLMLHKLAMLRDKETEPKKFRELIREISMLLAYESTADLALKPVTVTTPLTQTKGFELSEVIGLVPVLRAGLGMVDGFWEMMPAAEVWHIGLYRDHKTFEPVHYYNKLPVSPTVQVCVILDPMLATGGTAVEAVQMLKDWGAKRIKYVGLIGAPEGIRRLQTAHPDVEIYLAAVDERLNENAYILPGLGDAGDRQFGTG
jgi:uracil phosphoribosyltransferase